MTAPTSLREGIRTEDLYDFDVVRVEPIGVERARQTLGERLRKAADKEDPVHTIVTKHGQPDGVIVSMDWYRKARKAMDEPTEW